MAAGLAGLWSGSPIVGTSRRMLTPGVSVGTMIIEKRWYGSSSGSRSWHITIRKSLIDAFDENHLWPLMTHSSPSRTAGVVSSVGSAPAPGSVIEKQRADLAVEQRLHPLLLLLVGAADGDQLGVAGVGRVVAEDRRRVGALAEDLVHQAELHLAEAAAAHVGREVRGPQALALDLLLQRRGDPVERSPALRRAPASAASRAGMISSRTNPRIQSSFASNSGSVEKSHAMAPPCRIGSRGNLPGVLEMVLTVGVLGFVGFRLASAAGHSFTAAGRSTTAPIVRGIRWRHVWPAPLVLIAVLVVATLLLQVPGLDWGWWSRARRRGQPGDRHHRPDRGHAARVDRPARLPRRCCSRPSPSSPWPRSARSAGAASSGRGRRRVRRTLEFGLAHALIGIPIGVALALSFGGAYFMAVYLRAYRVHHDPREAVLDSARAHAVYNVIIVVLVLITVVLIATGVASEP